MTRRTAPASETFLTVSFLSGLLPLCVVTTLFTVQSLVFLVGGSVSSPAIYASLVLSGFLWLAVARPYASTRLIACSVGAAFLAIAASLALSTTLSD